MPEAWVFAVFALGGALLAYTLTGGADFGGGVWDLLASGPRKKEQRAAIARVIAPIWEVNHVWLIAVVVLLFVCFPRGFGLAATALHLPLTMMLVGVVLRGTAFTFRAYGMESPEARLRWGFVFSLSSVLAPLFLGICAGTLASGAIRITDGVVTSGFVSPWAAPFPVLIGLLLVAQCAQLAAVYLTVELNGPLADDFRLRALVAGVAVVVLAWAALFVSRTGAPRVFETLTTPDTGGVLIHAVTAAAGVTGFAALVRRRYRVARVAIALQTAAVLTGWGLAQSPLLIVPDVAFVSVAAPASVISTVLFAFAIGAVLLIPALIALYRIFTPGTSSPT